jgi:lipopolysaccharide transport system permease protein
MPIFEKLPADGKIMEKNARKQNVFHGFLIIYRYRNILKNTTLNDVRARYSGTFLGLVWMILYPFLFLGLYAVVYTLIFRVRVEQFTTFDYVLVIFAGLIPFLGFAEALGSGVVSVRNSRGLIQNTLFPIEMVPVKTVLSSSVTMVVGLVMMLLILWFRGDFHLTQAAMPVIFLFQIVFTIGVIWLLSAFNVFFPDIGQITSVIVLMLMLISPIAYTADMIPENLMPLMYPNPLYYMIMLYRGALIEGQISLNLFLTFAGISLFIFLSGYSIFRRLKPLFSDFL